MALLFLAVSVILCTITIKVWRNQNYLELKSNLLALTLGFTAFNVILGLLLLFDALESNPDNLINELVRHLGTLSLLILCVVNGLFYTIITLLSLVWSGTNKK